MRILIDCSDPEEIRVWEDDCDRKPDHILPKTMNLKTYVDRQILSQNDVFFLQGRELQPVTEFNPQK